MVAKERSCLEYLIVKEAGKKWGIGTRIVTQYFAEGRIDGAVKKVTCG